MDLKETICTIPNYPIPGVMFRDITSLIQNGEALKESCDLLAEYARKVGAEVVVGPESRGFIFGCPIARDLSIGFVPIRKPGKLPRETISEEYSLEYGTNTLEVHKDAIKPGQKVLIVDDLLATGGTTEAVIRLVERLQGEVVGCAFVIELPDLKGRELLKGYDVYSLVEFEGD